jgi:hypothetical protein
VGRYELRSKEEAWEVGSGVGMVKLVFGAVGWQGIERRDGRAQSRTCLLGMKRRQMLYLD